jgi:cytidylate kinase
LTTEEIERLKGQQHNWWADFKRSFGLMPSYVSPQYINSVDMPDFLITDDIFQTECEILEGIAEDESCVIAGRSGFYIFRDHPNHLSVLIQASMKYRIDHLIGKRGITPDEARQIIQQVDKGRENYIRKYTKTSRYDTRNYDLVINMDDIHQADAIDIIMKFIR